MEVINKYFPRLTENQRSQFAQLPDLYADWNSKINVISRKDISEIMTHHVLHSLAIAKYIQFKPEAKVLDLGTGGGFPGIPLAIFFPETQFILMDGTGKKIQVVQAVADALGLDNVTAIHGRAEESKSKVDFVVSRAVAPLRDLWHWSLPILKAKGQGKSANAFDEPVYGGLICLKGGDLREEIKESGLSPLIWEIDQLFPEVFFKEKYVLSVKR